MKAEAVVSLFWQDWLIIVLFLLITISIGLYFSKRASGGLVDFFLGGRNFPWYLAGVSMVATTFAADTPLAVTEIVAENGISGNWLWWNMLIGGMLTTFFFARLWRRANVLTEVEFITLRYGGRMSRILRYVKAIYLGLIMNGAIIAWVNLAFVTILQVFFDLDKNTAVLWVFGVSLIIAIYSTLSGIWGVAINDFLQFFIAMTGSIALAYFVLDSPEIGGIAGLKTQLPADTFQFLPNVGSGAENTLVVGLGSFLAFIGVQWWASWYPGNEPGGGGYIAQRMMSAKTEKDSLLATLFFQFGHYCVRPWPWILVALCTLVLYPDLEKSQMGYVMAMKDFLPAGWKGLMLVAFGAAYMSTISTQLNWGAGYLTNDFIKPIFNISGDKKLVLVSRLSTIFLVLSGCLVTLQIESISGVWSFIIECGAGLGLVLILRWYWWRISALAEIVATVTPFVVYSICKFGLSQFDGSWGQDLFTNPKTFFTTVLITTAAWILTAFLGKAENRSTLDNFFERVRPLGIWNYKAGVSTDNAPLLLRAIAWVSAVIAVYSALFSVGYFLFEDWDKLIVSSSILALSLLLFIWSFNTSEKSEKNKKAPV